MTTTIVAHNYALHIHSDRQQADLASSSVKTISQICIPRTYTCSVYDSVLARDNSTTHVHVHTTYTLRTHMYNKTIVVYMLFSSLSCICILSLLCTYVGLKEV